MNLGVALLEQGDLIEALNTFSYVISIDPTNERARKYLDYIRVSSR